MLGIIGWAIFGVIVGAIAKLLMPGRDPGGLLVTMLLGIAGALVAGFIGRALGWYEPGEAAGFIMATVGAILLLFVYRKMSAKASSRGESRPAFAGRASRLAALLLPQIHSVFSVVPPCQSAHRPARCDGRFTTALGRNRAPSEPAPDRSDDHARRPPRAQAGSPRR